MEDPRIGVRKRVFEGWKARDFDTLRRVRELRGARRRRWTSVAYWVCEVSAGKIVSWKSFSDRRRALTAAGLEPPV